MSIGCCKKRGIEYVLLLSILSKMSFLLTTEVQCYVKLSFVANHKMKLAACK